MDAIYQSISTAGQARGALMVRILVKACYYLVIFSLETASTFQLPTRSEALNNVDPSNAIGVEASMFASA